MGFYAYDKITFNEPVKLICYDRPFIVIKMYCTDITSDLHARTQIIDGSYNK